MIFLAVAFVFPVEEGEPGIAGDEQRNADLPQPVPALFVPAPLDELRGAPAAHVGKELVVSNRKRSDPEPSSPEALSKNFSAMRETASRFAGRCIQEPMISSMILRLSRGEA